MIFRCAFENAHLVHTWAFFKENVRCPEWTFRDPISLILGTRFPLIQGPDFQF